MVAIRGLNLAVSTVGTAPVLTAPVPLAMYSGKARYLSYGRSTYGRGEITVLARATRAIRYLPTFYGDFYNRIYSIPASLSLVNPLPGQSNTFYLWNTFLTSKTVSAITSTNDVGVTFSLTVGTVLPGLALVEVNLIVASTVSTSKTTKYDVAYGSVHTLITANILITNLIVSPPNDPMTETWNWNTTILEAEDGHEQRISLRRHPAIKYNLTYDFGYEDTEADIYDKFFSSKNGLTIPRYQERITLSAPLTAGATVISIDTTEFDVQTDDQLFIEEKGSYEVLTVGVVSSGIVNLNNSPSSNYTASANVYRIAVLYPPTKPKIDRGPVNDTSATLELEEANTRTIFYSTAAGFTPGYNEPLKDRVMSRQVAEVCGLPVLQGRPIVEGKASDEFDHKFEIIGTDYGVKSYLSDLDKAKVTYLRKFHIRGRDMWFHYAYILNHVRGRQKAVWMPTWLNEVGPRIVSVAGTAITVEGSLYYLYYPADSSHIGLWMEHNGRYYPRKILSVTLDGGGNTVINVDQAFPAVYYLKTSFDVSFMVLARLAADQISFTHYSNLSMVDIGFTSIRESDDLT